VVRVRAPTLPSVGAAFTLTAIAYNLCHHVGSLPDGLGGAGRGTRVADWVDLAAPYLVLVPAFLAIVAARSDRATYALYVLGALLYTQGHGIHLAANSIGNTQPGVTAHFWDETAGHLIWYAGVAVVGAALARTMTGRRRPPAAYLLAAATGVTWSSNAVGADLALAGAVPALALVAYGVWQRRDQRALLAVAGAAAVTFLVAAFALGEA
jgi:hypothetical protein